MLALTGMLRVELNEDKEVRFYDNDGKINIEWDVINDLNILNKVMFERDIIYYKEHGVIDHLEFIVESNAAIYNEIVDKVVPVVNRYLSGDCKVVNIKWKYHNNLTNTTFTDKEISGDYILIATSCLTAYERERAAIWLRETIKTYVTRMCKKYSNNISIEEAMQMLEI